MTRGDKKKYKEYKRQDDVHRGTRAFFFKEKVLKTQKIYKFKKFLKKLILVAIIILALIGYKQYKSGELEQYQEYHIAKSYIEKGLNIANSFYQEISSSELYKTSKSYLSFYLEEIESVMPFTKSNSYDYTYNQLLTENRRDKIGKEILIYAELNSLSCRDYICKIKAKPKGIRSDINIYFNQLDGDKMFDFMEKDRAYNKRTWIATKCIYDGDIYKLKGCDLLDIKNSFLDLKNIEYNSTENKTNSDKPVRTTIDMNLKDKIW
jgi:hypothetical protein